MPKEAFDNGSHRILSRPIISEKSFAASSNGKYVFKVDPKANKITVRKAVEKTYGVKVSDVNMLNVRGKRRVFGKNIGRTSSWKKAIVTLAVGQTIAELNGGGAK